MRSLRRSMVTVLAASVVAMSAGHAFGGDRDHGRHGGGHSGSRHHGHGGWSGGWSSRSHWHSGGSSFSISIGSGWNDCYPSRVVYHRPVTYCPPPVVVHRPVVYTQPVVYAQPVVYRQPVVVEPVRVIQTQQVVQQPVVQQASYQPVYQAPAPAPAMAPAPATLPPSIVTSAPASSAAEDLTRALAAANQGEDRRAIELMRAYFRIYATPPSGLVISRPMLERLEAAYAQRCELEEPSPDTYFVLATLRGLLGDRSGAIAALDAGKAWGDQDASSTQVRAWLETR